MVKYMTIRKKIISFNRYSIQKDKITESLRLKKTLRFSWGLNG